MTLRSRLCKLSIIHCLTYSHLFQKTHVTVPWLLRVEQFSELSKILFLGYNPQIWLKIFRFFLRPTVNCRLQNWPPEQNRKTKMRPTKIQSLFFAKKFHYSTLVRLFLSIINAWSIGYLYVLIRTHTHKITSHT